MVDISGVLGFGGLGGIAMGWLNTGIFWGVASACSIVALFLGLIMRKRRKINKPVLEMLDHSNGVFEFRFKEKGGGWFESKRTLFGLYDYGRERVFRLADGTRVDDISDEDYRLINGKHGLVVVRVPHDRNYIMPISKFFLDEKTKIVMSQIAPVDVRSAIEKGCDEAEDEMQNKWKEILPWVMIGVIGLIMVFGLILITQYGKHNVDVAAQMLKEAKIACGQAIASSAP